MFPFGQAPSGADVQDFYCNSQSSGSAFSLWRRPPGAKMLYMLTIGGGGSGGNGVVAAAASAAGGGGGGTGGQTTLLIPAWMLPEELFICVGRAGAADQGKQTSVCVSPDTAVNGGSAACIANGGNSGGNASSGNAGSAGGAAAVANVNQMYWAGGGLWSLNAGQAGLAGSVAGVPSAQGFPNQGLRICGGTGGGGVPAAGAGSNGGGMTANGPLIGFTGGLGGSSTTTPGSDGNHAFPALAEMGFIYPGLGGGSSHATATGAGLFGGNGGRGNFGSGGGGGGGCLTGGTAGVGGKGGDGFCRIVAW